MATSSTPEKIALDDHLQKVKEAQDKVAATKQAFDAKSGTGDATEKEAYDNADTAFKILNSKTSDLQSKATAEAAKLVLDAATAVDAAAKAVENLTPGPMTPTSGPIKRAKDEAKAAAAAAAEAAKAAKAAASATSPIVIDTLIAAAKQVSEASDLVVAAANKLIEESTTEKKAAAAAAAAADKLAKAALEAANILKPEAVAAAAPAASPASPILPATSEKEKAMALIKSLSVLLAKDTAPTLAELKETLDKSGLIPTAGGGGGGGKMHRKKKTGISRRIRRSRVGANTRRSREFY